MGPRVSLNVLENKLLAHARSQTVTVDCAVPAHILCVMAKEYVQKNRIKLTLQIQLYCV